MVAHALTFAQSIMQYNGGSVVAMVGKDCVAIASDLRLGVQSLSISSNFEKVGRQITATFYQDSSNGFSV